MKTFNYVLSLPSFVIARKLSDYLLQYHFRLEFCIPGNDVNQEDFPVSVSVPSFLKDSVVSFLNAGSVNFNLSSK